MLIVTISSQRVFGHKGQCELSGLESIKQLRLNSSQLGNTITINVTKRCLIEENKNTKCPINALYHRIAVKKLGAYYI